MFGKKARKLRKGGSGQLTTPSVGKRMNLSPKMMEQLAAMSFLDWEAGARAADLLGKSATIVLESTVKLEARCGELDKKHHECLAESNRLEQEMKRVADRIREVSQLLRDKEDQYKAVEAELEHVDGDLASESGKDAPLPDAEKRKLLEKREELHHRLEGMLREKEASFAKKKERFELPMERKALYEEWRRQVERSQLLAAERDVKGKVLAERKLLHEGITALLKEVGAPPVADATTSFSTHSSVIVEATSKAVSPEVKREGDGDQALAERAADTKKEPFFLITTIKRLLKRDVGGEV